MTMSAPVIAGTVSTIFFVSAELPMVLKAFRTRDLASCSLGNILIANAGNLVYSIYVFSLPLGPIWLMHTFYVTTTAVMLALYVRYEMLPGDGPRTWVSLLTPTHRDYPTPIPQSGNQPAPFRP